MESKARALPKVPLISGAFLALALLVFYLPVLVNLAKTLSANEDFSYGLLLPFVSGYIIYQKWPQLRRTPWRPSWAGLVLLALGFGLYIFGELAASLYIPSLSFVVALTGLIVTLGGWEILRLLAFPLFLLVFMIPMEGYLVKKITLPLQLLSSRLAAGFLHVIGIPVLRQGNIIDLGVRQLQIVEACSGLRYILALLALGAIYCYFYQRRPWKAALILISLIPAAIVANALRLAAMGIFPELQAGFWHSFSGWLIFVVCFGLVALLNCMLNHFWPQSPGAASQKTHRKIKTSGANRNSSYTPHLIAGCLLVVIAGPLALSIGQAPASPLRQSFDRFPLELGSWKGKRFYIDPAIEQVLKSDTYLNVEYRHPKESQVSLWIAYYDRQGRGKSFHSPLICLTGGGWHVKESGTSQVGPGLPVRYLVMDQAGNLVLVYYWYLQRGRWVTSEFLNKFYMAYDGLLSRRTDGALIRLITPVGKDVSSARERLNDFARRLVPLLPNFIPG